MTYRIDGVKTLTVGTTAQDVDVRCQSFLIENISESAVIYFKEKDNDSVACTASNGFALAAGGILDTPLCAGTLSVIASDEGADVRLLFLG